LDFGSFNILIFFFGKSTNKVGPIVKKKKNSFTFHHPLVHIVCRHENMQSFLLKLTWAFLHRSKSLERNVIVVVALVGMVQIMQKECDTTMAKSRDWCWLGH